MTHKVLHELLDHSAQMHPSATAVEEPVEGAITYGDLAALSDRLRDRLSYLQVQPGDRLESGSGNPSKPWRRSLAS